MTVLKPHGCLSWHERLGKPYSIPNCTLDDCLIITPGLNKCRKGYSEPFDTHRSRANAAIDQAQRYVKIGYGFGDDHLETHLVRQLKNDKSALILEQNAKLALEVRRLFLYPRPGPDHNERTSEVASF